jgi:hypothetical protein
MSTITVTPSDHRETARRAVVPAALTTFAVAAVLSVTGAHTTAEWVVEVVVQAVVTALVFGLVVARGLRHESAGGRGLAMGILGLLLVVPAFWTGLPLLLGTGSALLGSAGRRASTGSAKATAAMVVGVLAVVAYAAIYVVDYLQTHGIG